MADGLRLEMVRKSCFCAAICQAYGEPRELWWVEVRGRPLTLSELAHMQGEIVAGLLSPRKEGAMARATGTRPGLTEAEREVLRLMARGHTNEEIARLRGVEISTVRCQQQYLRKALGMESVPDLRQAARELYEAERRGGSEFGVPSSTLEASS